MKAAVDKHFPTESAAIMKAWRSGAREVQGRFNLIAKKYGGYASASTEGPAFILSILIPIIETK